MKSKVNRALVVILALLLVLGSISFAGCGGQSAQEEAPEPPVNAGGLEAGFFSQVMSGLINGASRKAGSDIMGWVLSSVGWGGSGDTQLLNEMNQKLDDIKAELDQVNAELKQLYQQLKITEDEILAQVTSPKAAEDSLYTWYDNTFIPTYGNKKPGEIPPQQILDFCNLLENGSKGDANTPPSNSLEIENDVVAIFHAMVPGDPQYKSALDNCVDLTLDKGYGIWDCYNTLEQYFCYLLHEQIKGVNLVMEARQAQAQAGQTLPFGPAQQYIDNYTKTMLNPQVDRFIYNVARLVTMKSDMTKIDGYLTGDGAGVCARGDFLSLSVLAQKDFGLHGWVFAEASNPSMQLDASGPSYAKSATGAESHNPGPTFEVWDDPAKPQKMSVTNNWYFRRFAYSDAPVGAFQINSGGNPFATAKVQQYKDDYTLDPSGSILYGSFAVGIRRNNLLFSGVDWSVTKNSSSGNRGGTNNSYTVAAQGAKNINLVPKDTTDYSVTWVGELIAQRSWTYTGQQPVTINIHCSAVAVGHCTGDNYTSTWTYHDISYIIYEMGVWNASSQRMGTWTSVAKQSEDQSPVTTINDNPAPVVSFTMQPGQSYSIVLHVYDHRYNKTTVGNSPDSDSMEETPDMQQAIQQHGSSSENKFNFMGDISLTCNGAVATF